MSAAKLHLTQLAWMTPAHFVPGNLEASNNAREGIPS